MAPVFIVRSQKPSGSGFVAAVHPETLLLKKSARRPHSGESRFNLSSNFFAHSVESTSDFGGSLAGDGEIGTVIGVQTFLGDAESAGTACTVFEGEDVVAAPDEEAATDL
jgi:hypothetical protein